ncbi:hypothetical protein [Halofilum ochraceum]|uniref:hypothetical protein n=1 Tax=Halofilum ochraceum TaxID=1611323 RepID=UPI001113153F|nr:hypothetical protein [Halofilum ochraceum]
MSMIPPPIETEGTPVSTAADDATEPLPASCQDGFVWVVHARMTDDSTANQYLGIAHDGSAAETIQIRTQANGTLRFEGRSGSVNIFGIVTSAFTTGQDLKIAMRAQGGKYAISVNGGAVTTDSTPSFPSGMTTKSIGANWDGNFVWNSTIALDYLDPDPSAWTDADLQAATS